MSISKRLQHYFKQFMAFIGLMPPPEARSVADDAELTNQMIFNELVKCFETGRKKETFATTMRYPSYYYIVMHEDEFKKRAHVFGVMVQEVINEFYAKITETKSGYKSWGPFTNHWFFQFSPCSSDHFLGQKIMRNKAIVMGTCIGSEMANIKEEAKVRVTMRPPNATSYEEMDINVMEFRALEVLNNGVFKYKFDPELKPLGSAVPSLQPRAKFKYSTSIDKVQIWSMNVNEIVITNQGDNGSANVMVIENVPEIENSHVRIKYDAGYKQFFLAAFAPVTLNQVNVALSSGEIINWVSLSNQSKLLFGGRFSIVFEASA